MLYSGSSGNAHALRLRLSGTRIIPHIGLKSQGNPLELSLYGVLNSPLAYNQRGMMILQSNLVFEISS